MNKIKPLNLALGMVIAVVATSLFGTHLLSSLPKTDVISTSTKNNFFNPSDLKKDTLST